VRPGLLGRQTAACRAVGVCRMPIALRRGRGPDGGSFRGDVSAGGQTAGHD